MLASLSAVSVLKDMQSVIVIMSTNRVTDRTLGNIYPLRKANQCIRFPLRIPASVVEAWFIFAIDQKTW